MKFNAVIFKSKQSDEISTSRSKVTWSDVLRFECSKIVGCTMALGLMKISTKDSSIRAEGLHKHGIYFGKKILNKRKRIHIPNA